MQLHQLRYFVAVTEAGSISRAAELLSVSQPSVSVAIKNLENELGGNLLKRNSRGISLTSFGASFYKSANQILSDIDALKAPKEPSISICMDDCNATLMRHISDYSQKNPEQKFFINYRNRGERSDREYDFFVSEERPSVGSWHDYLNLFGKYFLAVLPASDKHAQKEIINAIDLKKQQFVFTCSDDGKNFERVYMMCVMHGFTPHVCAMTNSPQQKIELLQTGKFCGIICSNWYEHFADNPLLKVIPIRSVGNWGKYYSLYYSEKTKRNQAAMQFLEYMTEQTNQHPNLGVPIVSEEFGKEY